MCVYSFPGALYIGINGISALILSLRIATLAALEKGSANRPGKPPIYIHISGCGIISDDARGEPVEFVKEWADINLDLKSCALCA